MSWYLKEKLQRVLAAEQGASVFPPGQRQGFALVYPNTYNVGMSNLGFHIIYQQINSRGDTACERLFLPNKQDEQEYIRTNTPLMSLENQRPLYEFPLIGFALSFELDYFNVLKILSLGKVALLASERGEQDPIIIIGGPCATFNSEPMAAFADVCVIGEGEETIHELLDVYYQGRRDGLSRQEILRMMAGIEGVYVPRFYLPMYDDDGIVTRIEQLGNVPGNISRRWVRNLDRYQAQTVILTEDTEFKDMFLIETARGCGRHCRFCMAGFCFRRPRARSLDSIAAAVAEAKKFRAKVGLVGAAISDYPEIDKLCELILEQDMGLSVASLRADSLTPTLVRALATSGHKTITLAPEAASERLRRVINKGISDKNIYDAVTMAIEAGIPNVRLYIMVGLPFEIDEDIEAVTMMAKDVKRHMERLGSKGRLTLSINPFIPKPFTPFQWLPMAALSEVEAKLKSIQTVLRSQKGIEVLVESPKEAYIQGVLARGDRRLSDVLLACHEKGGSKAWKQVMKESGLDAGFYLYRRRELTEVLPWHHLDMGISNDYLVQELHNAEKEVFTAPCVEGCKRCGVCV